MERQVKWILTSFLNILRLPAKIRSISPQNLWRTVTLLKYGVICWTSLTLIAVSLARPESRMILLTVWTITFQGYIYARSKVGVWLAWAELRELLRWAVTRATVKEDLDQSTVCWPAQGHGARVTAALTLPYRLMLNVAIMRMREIFTRFVRSMSGQNSPYIFTRGVIINNWGQIWRLTLALRYWGIPVIVAILKNVIVHEAHEFGCNSIIVSLLSLKYPSDI